MKAFVRPGIDSLASIGVMAFSIANLNAIMTSIILALTIIYWVQKIRSINKQK